MIADCIYVFSAYFYTLFIFIYFCRSETYNYEQGNFASKVWCLCSYGDNIDPGVTFTITFPQVLIMLTTFAEGESIIMWRMKVLS